MTKDINELLQIFINQCNELQYKCTTIIFMNPFDILELDMSEFTDDKWFISYHVIERGKCIILKDDCDEKRELYNLFSKKEFQDRIWKGTKKWN